MTAQVYSASDRKEQYRYLDFPVAGPQMKQDDPLFGGDVFAESMRRLGADATALQRLEEAARAFEKIEWDLVRRTAPKPPPKSESGG